MVKIHDLLSTDSPAASIIIIFASSNEMNKVIKLGTDELASSVQHGQQTK